MITISPTEWIAITAQAGMSLYAILSNVSEAQTVKNYYLHDGTQTPYGLYSQTPYENWFSVMPMIVQLDENSPFLNWISQTEHKDWGWLARSHLPFESICAHLRSLTQIIMPKGETVFFRYWDGEYLSIMLNYMGNNWQDILPAFAFYWINGETFTTLVPVDIKPRQSPWWQIGQDLLNQLTEQNPTPLIDNLMQRLKEDYCALFFQYPERHVRSKVIYFIENHAISDDTVADQLIDYLIQEEI